MKIQTRRAPASLFSLIVLMLALATMPALASAAAGSQAHEALTTQIEALKQGQEAMQKDIAEIRKILEQIVSRGRPKPFQPLDLSVAGAPSRGKPDAPVILVEFTDFQCPFCGRYFKNTFPEVIKQYVDTGKVRYVLREMPLTQIHPYAEKAAEAALCAGDQGKFWEMHDALFKDQGHLKPEDLAKRAGEIDLDVPQFSHCLESGAKAEAVKKDLEAGAQAGVHGTPSFFLGLNNAKQPETLHATRMVTGARPFAAFKQAIDALLAPPAPPEKGTSSGGS